MEKKVEVKKDSFFKKYFGALYSFVMRHKLLFAILALLLAWSPILISAYPGIVTFDQSWSLLQFFGSGSLNITTDDPSYLGHFLVDHKPFLFTLILGAFVKVGGFLGSQNLGLFTLVIAQSVLMAYVLALALRKLWRSGLHRFSIGALIFLAIIPILPANLASPSNDNIFVALFLWWLIILFDIVQNRGKEPLSKSQFIKLLVLSVLLPLFKKVGIYIILVSLIVFLIPKCYRLIKKQVLIIIGTVVASAVIVSFVVYPIMDIAPGGKQEALGTLFQQTAAYTAWNSSDVAEDDKNTINEVLDYNCISTSYDAISHDPAKRCYRFDTTTGELINYLLVWAKQGLGRPITYLRAWWSVAKNYIINIHEIEGYTNKDETIERALEVVMETQSSPEQVSDVSSQITLSAPDWAMSLRKRIQSLLYEVYNDTPLVIFVAGAVYTTWIPIVCFILIIIYRRKWLIWLLPIFLTMLVVYVSPIYLSRYFLPMYLVDPFLIGVAVLAVKHRKKTSGINTSQQKNQINNKRSKKSSKTKI